LTNGRETARIWRVPRRFVLSAFVLGGVALLGILTANAVSSTAARSDPPLKSQTYSDPPSDAPFGTPDISSVLAENWSDGTIGFKISIPRESTLFGNQGIGVYIDSDVNRSTGQSGDDYIVGVIGQYGANPTYSLLKWTASGWTTVASQSLQGEFHAGDGVFVTFAKSELQVGSAFNFDVWAYGNSGGTRNYDQAPDQPNYFTYTLGVAPVTTTTTPPTTTTTPQQVERLAGRVGPGATIVFARSAKTGKATITINDRTAKDNFHLSGPGINRKTGVVFQGRVVWSVTLAKGTYVFRSDAHARLRGTLKVS
jgi:hypothetical protein